MLKHFQNSIKIRENKNIKKCLVEFRLIQGKALEIEIQSQNLWLKTPTSLTITTEMLMLDLESVLMDVGV
jgi:hypothetical protein